MAMPLEAAGPWFPQAFGNYMADSDMSILPMDRAESLDTDNDLSWEETHDFEDGSSLPDLDIDSVHVSAANNAMKLINFSCTSDSTINSNSNTWETGLFTRSRPRQVEHDSYSLPYDLSLTGSRKSIPQEDGSQREPSTSPHSSMNDSNHRQRTRKNNNNSKNVGKNQPRAKPGSRGKRGGKSVEEEDIFRMRFLEKNRRAANKCRAKKRNCEEDLQHRAHILTRENAQLGVAKIGLTNELLHLKGMLLDHVDCDCVVIRDYIKEAATNVMPNKEIHQMCCSRP